MGLIRYSCSRISVPHEPIPTKFGLWMFFIMLHRYMVSKMLKCKKSFLWRHHFCTLYNNMQFSVCGFVGLFVCLSRLLLGNGKTHKAQTRWVGGAWSNLDFLSNFFWRVLITGVHCTSFFDFLEWASIRKQWLSWGSNLVGARSLS